MTNWLDGEQSRRELKTTGGREEKKRREVEHYTFREQLVVSLLVSNMNRKPHYVSACQKDRLKKIYTLEMFIIFTKHYGN